MFNHNHQLKTINKVLNLYAHNVYRKSKDEFVLQDKTLEVLPDKYDYQDCGFYYKKKDLIDAVNYIIETERKKNPNNLIIGYNI